MKRKLLFYGLLLAVLPVFLSGCSSTVASGQSGSQNTAAPSRDRRPDFGQPERQPDLRGLVKSMVGNEATILKIDMNALAAQRASSTNGRADQPATGNGAGAAVSITAVGGPVGATGGNRGGGRGGAVFFGGQGGGSDSEARARMVAALKEISTGEEKVVIPVGIRMLKSSYDASTKKRTMVEATLADVTADKNITIWLNQSVSDRKVAEFVLIN